MKLNFDKTQVVHTLLDAVVALVDQVVKLDVPGNKGLNAAKIHLESAHASLALSMIVQDEEYKYLSV